MKVSELKALIRDMPDDAEIPPIWAGGTQGDAGTSAVLRGFHLGTEVAKMCLNVLGDFKNLGEEDEEDEDDDEDDEVAEDNRVERTIFNVARLEAANQAFDTLKVTLTDLQGFNQEWNRDGDRWSRLVWWVGGPRVAGGPSTGSIGVEFKPGTAEVVVCEVNN